MEAPVLEFPTYAFFIDGRAAQRVETQEAWDALLKEHPDLRNYPFTDEERLAHRTQPAHSPDPVPDAETRRPHR